MAGHTGISGYLLESISTFNPASANLHINFTVKTTSLTDLFKYLT
ncbi:hypothetical protein [Mucilaginibacter hurinus]|nr:hypothetical protein [Mucilaginibacter hurinus]